MPNAPMLPLLIGVSGHRDIHPDALPIIRERLSRILGSLSELYGNQIYLMTALAEGADQETAEIALALNMPLVCILPMERTLYRRTMSAAAATRLDRILDHDSVILRLTLPPVATTESDPEKRNILQYEQLGVLLARQSHILLALWDGEDPDTRTRRPGYVRTEKRGGTAHVIAIRTNGEYTEVSDETFRNSALFNARLPRLELARCGPILHLRTPRSSSGTPDLAHAGAVRWWNDLSTETQEGVPPAGDAANFWHDLDPVGTVEDWCKRLLPLLPRDFRFIIKADAALARIIREHPALCARNGSYLTPNTVPELASGTADPELENLRSTFAAADTLSFLAQQKLLGDWAPGLPWRKRAPGRQHLGALFWFAAAVPFAVLFFEIYCEYGKNPVFLGLYGLVFAISAAVYFLSVKPHGWQTLYQDHRALAEALRVQFYWALSGVPLSVSDNYLRQHEGELGWIRLALRGPSLCAMASALQQKTVPCTAIQTSWMDGQKDYFQNRVTQYEKAAKTLRRLTKLTIGTLALVIVFLFSTQLSLGGELPEEWPEWLREIPSVIIGVLPAILAFLLAFQELRLFEEHTHAYEQAAGVFAHASRQATEINEALGSNTSLDNVLDHEWKALVVALGKESLAENATWYSCIVPTPSP